ncbi:sulfatase-like hydrolase/transferase [Aquimarina aggregata]|uniref:sulfatase-like hydrolase/transferase n=1 Tax=Aquimarina aggregata TaxID=1642818 RepID=UPI00248FB393|nr:sulfatase-like hydrolase/transferase [Aquimarina aggregata]
MTSKRVFKLLLIIEMKGCYSCNKQKREKTPEKKEYNTRPNIILFVADDHGIDTLGAYGNLIIETLNLDKLTTEGTKFTNAYCASAGASCAASRSVILSGQFEHARCSYGDVHDYHHFNTYENIKSLPVLLEKEEYTTTARIGKPHVALEKIYHLKTVLKANPRNIIEKAKKCKNILNLGKPFFFFWYFLRNESHRDH